MKWGFFTPIHIATLLAAAAMNLGLYYFLKHKSVKVQTLVMLYSSLSILSVFLGDVCMMIVDPRITIASKGGKR